MVEIEISPGDPSTWPCTESWQYAYNKCVACECALGPYRRFCKGCRGIACETCHPQPSRRVYPVCARYRETD